MCRMLILSCSSRKKPTNRQMPAIERYDGPAFRVLRKFLREQNRARAQSPDFVRKTRLDRCGYPHSGLRLSHDSVQRQMSFALPWWGKRLRNNVLGALPQFVGWAFAWAEITGGQLRA